MSLETNAYRVNDAGNDISKAADCGWRGIPTVDGTFNVTFYNDDVDAFEWDLTLIFASDEPGVPFTNSASSTLTEVALMVLFEGKPVAHSITVDADNIDKFEDVVEIIRQVKASKPKVSKAAHAANVRADEAAKKPKDFGMGSPADVMDKINKLAGKRR